MTDSRDGRMELTWSTLAISARWESIAPFGTPLVPLVYSSTAMSSPALVCGASGPPAARRASRVVAPSGSSAPLPPRCGNATTTRSSSGRSATSCAAAVIAGTDEVTRIRAPLSASTCRSSGTV